ncbi:Wzz/FepE/Etk N-terminal domain-containing protein [Campylobacter suis]|uniref:Polysaccharide chain length determinant N-terminal domain-containing protein n=1 Tax=Campylobacter suis TaxID=2790657 RepID=A0ABM8Q354_9BACT|nr:Wzz/FepE/Etk N-terminal domain-containing protein [Campylobacter suis]CAD7287289.1 hypothetical protein LMG8286_00915 [Campylobacter suis]
MIENHNQQATYQDDEIDILELFKKVWRYKKYILTITFIFATLSLFYTSIKIPMYKASALVEIGYFKHEDTMENIQLANADDVVRKLQFLKSDSNLEYKITAVRGKRNFLNIDVFAISNDIAKAKIYEIVNNLSDEHKNKLSVYLDNKKINLADVERQIKFLKDYKIVEKQEQIEYIKNTQLPRINRQIAYMQEKTIPEAKRALMAIDDIVLPSIEKSLEINSDKMARYKKELENLQIHDKDSMDNILQKQMLKQGIYSQISSIEQNLLSLEGQKYALFSQTKPNAQDRLDRLINIDLENLNSEKDTIMNDKLLTLQRELATLQTEELNKLLDQKSLIELSLKPYNYQNTAIVSDIAISERPVKPRKAIILAIAALAGLMMSVFGVLVYDVIRNRARKDI